MDISDLDYFSLKQLIAHKIELMNTAFQRGIDNLENNKILPFNEYIRQAIALSSEIYELILEISDESIQAILFERLKEFVQNIRIIGEAVKDIYERNLSEKLSKTKELAKKPSKESCEPSIAEIHETQQVAETTATLSVAAEPTSVRVVGSSVLPEVDESIEAVEEIPERRIAKSVDETISSEAKTEPKKEEFVIPDIPEDILDIIPSDMAAAYNSAKVDFELKNYEKSFLLFKEIAKWGLKLVEDEKDPMIKKRLREYSFKLVEIAKNVKQIVNEHKKVPRSGVVIETSLVSVDGEINYELVSRKVSEFMKIHPEVLAWAIFKRNGTVAWQTQNWNLNMDGITLVMAFKNRESTYLVQNIPYNLVYSDDISIIASNPDNRGHIFMIHLGNIYLIAYGLPSTNINQVLSEMIKHFKS